ncbi:hypothetical protein KKH23_10480 [Patescibacteria group bacterium]|nr:hypothetical protein [Patescibacteria group bacterium]
MVIRLDIDPSHAICDRHKELFQQHWPVGYLEFVSLAVQHFLKKPEVAERVQRLRDETPALRQRGGPVDEASIITYLLTQKLAHEPLCCQLLPETLYDILIEVDKHKAVWASHCCVLCGLMAPCIGRPKIPLNGDISPLSGHYEHVCLACVCGVFPNR